MSISRLFLVQLRVQSEHSVQEILALLALHGLLQLTHPAMQKLCLLLSSRLFSL